MMCCRLFDGVAALLGVRLITDYEGQAAMELESLAWEAWDNSQKQKERYQSTLLRDNSVSVLDSRPLVSWIIEDLDNGVTVNTIALAFHNWLIRSICQLIQELSSERAINTVVLGGGSFQNRLLLEGVEAALSINNLQVFSGQQVPVNDGGIAIGQAYIGGGKYNVSGNTNEGH